MDQGESLLDQVRLQRLLKDNGLSLVLGSLFIVFLVGHSIAGLLDYNAEQQSHGQQVVGYLSYLTTAHFLESVAENWESEFLQIFGYVMLTAFLFQRGSAESKDPDQPDPVDRDPRLEANREDAPWPVRRGGLILRVYEQSLSLAFLVIFITTFVLHAVSGAREYNAEQLAHSAGPELSTLEYIGTARFWFESLQNWQSEFLAIAAVVVFSIYLRQRGSPESKPVDAPHSSTGKE